MDSINIVFNKMTDTSLIWTVVLALSAVASVFVAIKMWGTTKKYTEVTENIFLSSQRPYIGKEKHIIKIDENNKTIHFSNIIKNFGSVPAKKVSCSIKLFIKGSLQKIDGGESKDQIFFPQENHSMDLILNLNKVPTAFCDIINGVLPLEILMEIEYYDAADRRYFTNETEIYNHTIKTFIKKTGDLI